MTNVKLLELAKLCLWGRSIEILSVLAIGEKAENVEYVSLLFIPVLKGERTSFYFFFQIRHVAILSMAKSRQRWW